MPGKPPAASRTRPQRARRVGAADGKLARSSVSFLRQWTLRLSAAYLVGALLATLLLWGLADSWWPASLLLFMGRWVLLLPLAALVPLALLLLSGRALLLLASAALVVVFPFMGLQLSIPTSEAEARSAPGHLRIVTLNAHNSMVVAAELTELLEVWQADVVAFQECGAMLSGAVRSLPGWHTSAGGNMCLVSRYPILGEEPMDRTDLAGVGAASAIGGAGFVVRYELQLPGEVLRVTNLHLETPRKGFEGLMRGSTADLLGNTELRAIEARLARRWADSNGDADIIAGDFNTPPESRIYRSAWGSLRNAFTAAGAGLGYTRHNGWIKVRIDHVLTSSRWRPLRAVVGDDVGSDHLPLIVDVARVAE